MKKPLTDKHGEVRELEESDFRHLVPFPDGLPAPLVKTIRTRGKQLAPTKTPVTIRLSQDVLDHFKATGKGWQTRIDQVLKKYIQG
jgi:uncharacterized protein (DUF4415 family)